MSLEKARNISISKDLDDAFNSFNEKEFYKADGSKFPQNNDREDLYYAIKHQLFDKVDFVYDLTNSKYTTVSNLNMKTSAYSGQSFLVKLAKAYKRTFGVNNQYLYNLDFDGEKHALKELKYVLPAVETFTSFPNKKNGALDIDGFETYNHFNHNQKLVELRKLAKEGEKLTSIKDMNWSEYPEIEFLFRFLLNEKENKAYDYNSETGKNDFEVSLFEKMMHYLSALISETDKIGVCFTFQSPVQGVGKGVVYEKILKDIIGNDFISEMDNKTIQSGFNEEIDGSLFTMFNECAVPQKLRVEFNSKIKTWITDHDVLIHAKHKKPVLKPNFCNFMIFTNEDVPFLIEKNDRRFIVVKTPHLRLDSAVKQVLGMDMDEYLARIEKTRDMFFYDLLRFDHDIKFVRLKAPMTEAKKAIIQKTNTIAKVVAEQIKGNDLNDLNEFLTVQAELKPDQIYQITEETKHGFLTPASTDILFEVFKGSQTEEMNTTKKNVYFTNLFGEMSRVYYKTADGKRKEQRAYKLPHYTPELAQAYFTVDVDVKDIKKGESLGFQMTGFSF